MDININNLEKEFELRTNQNFKEFYRLNKPKLLWYITKYTKNSEIAEDHVEDAFIQALLNINTYKRPEEGGAQVNTWIYKIAENIVKKSYKDNSRLPITSLDKDLSENFNLSNIIPYDDSKKNVEEELIKSKKAKVCIDAINNLSDKDLKYKRVLIMRHIDGMAYKEISEELNINLSTIKSQIKKGRHIIKKKIIKKCQEIDNNGIENDII